MIQRIFVLMLAAMIILGAQENDSQSAKAVVITTVPPSGPGGPDRTDRIEGKVTVQCDGCRVVLFAKGGDTWYVQPLADSVYTEIVDGKWQNETHLGSEYAAMLVKPGYVPPPKTAVLPPNGGGVVAVTIMPGSK